MTARLRAAFDRAAKDRRAALVAYLTFGDPRERRAIAQYGFSYLALNVTGQLADDFWRSNM